MRVLTISDLHAPFHHSKALDFLARLKNTFRPKIVVCLGDEIDAHGWSAHGREADAPGQGDELAAARGTLAELYKLFPRCFVCRSNHGARAGKTASRAGLPSELIRDPRSYLEAPSGWEWDDFWQFDNVLYLHGDGYRGQLAALDAAKVYRCDVVMGHVHTAGGINYSCNTFNCVWGMSAGCLIDPHAVAFRYAKHSKVKPVLGTGVVEDGIPRFVPLS